MTKNFMVSELRPRPPRVDPVHATEIGRRVAEMRGHANLSQTQVGQALGVTMQQISKIERGINRLHAEQIVRLCRLLKVSADELLGLEP